MTIEDKIIQDLRRENDKLKKQVETLTFFVETGEYPKGHCIRCGALTDGSEYCEICRDDLFGV